MLLAALTLAAGTAQADPLRVVRLTSGEWEPWSGPDLPEGGIATRIVRDAFAARGITVEIGWFPWARAWELARTDAWDGSFAWVPDESRRALVRFSEPIYVGTTVFLHRRGEALAWETVDDLAAKRIGITHGYGYGPDFESALRSGKLQTDPAPSDEANLRKLLAGRIDLFPIDDIVGLALARRILGPDAAKLAFDPRPVHRSTNHLIVRRDHPRADEILAAFAEGLKAVKGQVDPHRWLERWGTAP